MSIKIKQTIKELWSNKLVRIVAIAMLAIIIISIILAIALPSNHGQRLSKADRQLQTNIQQVTNNDQARIVQVLKQDGDWSLVKLNLADDPGNYAMVIMKGDQLVLGPASDFTIDVLANNNIPDSIIDYLYPDKPHWIGFAEAFQTSLQASQATIKGVIEAYAYTKNIQLNKVTMTSDVSKQTINPHDENMAGILKFNFRINDNDTEYTYQSTYRVKTQEYTNQVLDQNGTVLYTSNVTG